MAVRYGEVARLPWGRETFERGAFGDVGAADVILRFQHNRDRPIARTPATLQLVDTAEALRVFAPLPETREAEDALRLVRAGVLRGLSLEFRAGDAPIMDGVRTIRRAGLLGLGLVDTPAYDGSIVEARAYEMRQDGDGLEGRFFYDVDTVTSDRAEHRRGDGVRKGRVRPGAFRFALEDETREIQLLMGRAYDRPLGSKLAGTLELEDGPEALAFRVARLPDTSYVRDFRAQLEGGAAQFGVAPLYRIPPPEVVKDAVSIVPEAGNPGVNIEVVNEAVLTGLSVVTRPPRGNPGTIARRRRRMAVTVILTPPPTSPGARTVALAVLGVAIGTEDDLTVTERLLGVASALVEDYAPGAPQAVRNEAVIRVAGALQQSDFGGIASESLGDRTVSYFPQASGGWSPFRKSGAMGLLSPWRPRRAAW